MKFNDVPFLMGGDLAGRRNVAWRVELGRPHQDNPLIETDRPWADGVSFQHGTVLRDPIDGAWEIWGTAAPNATRDRRLVHYTSPDGVHWQSPSLGLCPFEGDPNTNILLDFASGGNCEGEAVYGGPDEDRAGPEHQRPDVEGRAGPRGTGRRRRAVDARYATPSGATQPARPSPGGTGPRARPTDSACA